jgi:NAD(P)-dependent dehydrogenase (short-subunit alcohol dehydrogenase family)
MTANRSRLAGKVAIVSGGGSLGPGIGIGRGISIVMAREGAHVAVFDHDLAAANETVRLIESEGGAASAWEVDVTDEAATGSVIDSAVAELGHLDALVNVVGIVGAQGNAVTLDATEWDRVMRVNVFSMVSTVRHAVPHMAAAGGGSIINISSNGALLGAPDGLAYLTSKGAILTLTRCMAIDHGHDLIRVNCIAPGPIVTPAVETRGITPEGRRARQAVTLLDVEGTPWDIGYAAAFLASDEARWITGATLAVDGGISAAMRHTPMT